MSKNNDKQHSMLARRYYGIFAIAAAVYTFVTLRTPLANNQYQLTAAATEVLEISLIIPILLIWLIAVFGSLRFKQYAYTIRTSSEGQAYNGVANGLLAMSFGLIAVSLFGSLRGFVHSNDGLRTFTILSNYLNVAVQFGMYALIYQGSNKLLGGIDDRPTPQTRQRNLWVLLLLVAAVATYTALMFTNRYRGSTPDPQTYASFYLSDFMLLVTVVIPYALIWGLASLSIINLQLYQSKVKGVVYREVFKQLAQGLTLVLGFSVLLGMLSSLSGAFANTSLKSILVFVYVILVLYAVGFVIIAAGARKLSKIEEV